MKHLVNYNVSEYQKHCRCPVIYCCEVKDYDDIKLLSNTEINLCKNNENKNFVDRGCGGSCLPSCLGIIIILL